MSQLSYQSFSQFDDAEDDEPYMPCVSCGLMLHIAAEECSGCGALNARMDEEVDDERLVSKGTKMNRATRAKLTKRSQHSQRDEVMPGLSKKRRVDEVEKIELLEKEPTRVDLLVQQSLESLQEEMPHSGLEESVELVFRRYFVEQGGFFTTRVDRVDVDWVGPQRVMHMFLVACRLCGAPYGSPDVVRAVWTRRVKVLDLVAEVQVCSNGQLLDMYPGELLAGQHFVWPYRVYGARAPIPDAEMLRRSLPTFIKRVMMPLRHACLHIPALELCISWARRCLFVDYRDLDKELMDLVSKREGQRLSEEDCAKMLWTATQTTLKNANVGKHAARAFLSQAAEMKYEGVVSKPATFYIFKEGNGEGLDLLQRAISEFVGCAIY